MPISTTLSNTSFRLVSIAVQRLENTGIIFYQTVKVAATDEFPLLTNAAFVSLHFIGSPLPPTFLLLLIINVEIFRTMPRILYYLCYLVTQVYRYLS